MFWRQRGSERLRAGGPAAAGLGTAGHRRRAAAQRRALALHWALIGFGVDPATGVPVELLQRWQAGGRVWQWCQRSQGLHLAPPAQRLESLDESLLPRRVPLGWVAIVRPDRCVSAEGPADKVETMLRRALELVAAPTPPAASVAASSPATGPMAAYFMREAEHAA